jgi:preprotein translocase subunit SecG
VGVLAVLVVAAAVVAAVLLLRGDGTNVAASTTTAPQIVSSSTSTTVLPTTTTTVLSTTTTTTAVAAAPGDSPGEWVEVPVPSVPVTVQYASLSDNALLLETGDETSSKIYAYMLGSSSLIELPVKSPQAGATDIDGDLAVWWEGTYDDSTSSYSDQHIYTYRLPDGPVTEVAGPDRNPSYPQIAGGRVTWVQSTPLDSDPEEFSRMPIYGVRVNADGSPAGDPDELVPSAIANVVGDSGWTYSLTPSYLVWEQAQADSGLDAGSHVLTLGDAQTSSLGGDAWRPSASGNVVVYASEGLKAKDLSSQRVWNVDAAGDFPSTAPTFVAYFRPIQKGDTTAYEVVARGLDGGKEQVLGQVSNPPWLWAPVVASANHVAYVSDDGKPHLFEWQPGE